jgi:uncharacterized protein (TIGR03437 family)
MKMRALWIALGSIAMLALAFAQEGGDAPPAIAQWGITNWASRMPPQLPAGGIAPGSLISIRGWRLGPAPIEKIAIRIRHGEATVQAAVLSATENEIEARLPEDAPLGSATLQVVKEGRASLEWPVVIAESSFGAFARNGAGWGAGEIMNANGGPNSAAHSARPKEMVTLAGTGLGARPPRGAPGNAPHVLVAGLEAARVHVLPRAARRAGVDEISFALPEDTPPGCHVPVQVSSAPGVYSNTVTLAVSGKSGPCASANDWTSGAARTSTRLGTLALFHADLELAVSPTQTTRYPVDAGLASFAELDAGDVANPLFLFPPVHTCTTYSGGAGLHSITSPLAALAALPGKPLDAGAAIAVEGPGGARALPLGDAIRSNYWAVLGGHAPAPGSKETPLFLTPGEHRVSVPGGAGVGPFVISLTAAEPLIWQNREQVNSVDAQRGATVTWQPGAGRENGVVLIAAMNVDSRSGALGLCACLANSADASFHIPGYALANIPKSPERPRGFPLNLILLVEFPQTLTVPAPGAGLDRLLGFTASVVGRSVEFK